MSGNRCKSDCRSRGHEFDPGVILLPSPESFKKGCCQLQVKVCTQSTG